MGKYDRYCDTTEERDAVETGLIPCDKCGHVWMAHSEDYDGECGYARGQFYEAENCKCSGYEPRMFSNLVRIAIEKGKEEDDRTSKLRKRA